MTIIREIITICYLIITKLLLKTIDYLFNFIFEKKTIVTNQLVDKYFIAKF